MDIEEYGVNTQLSPLGIDNYQAPLVESNVNKMEVAIVESDENPSIFGVCKCKIQPCNCVHSITCDEAKKINKEKK